MKDHTIDPDQLYGTWRLVRSRATDADGRPIRDPWGPEPMGRLILERNGRMMAVLCDGRASLPPGKKRAYSSYCGNFVIEGDLLTTIIDAASDSDRVGSTQPRLLEFRGDELVLKPPMRKDGEQREIFWRLEARL